MATEMASVYNHLVARDTVKTWRWFDAWGPHVTKWELNPNNFPLASTTAVSGYTVTNVNSTLVMSAGADGGAVVFTPTGAENDGIQLQPITEAFYFASAWPAYFGCKLQVLDADQTDLLVGLTITDTTAATAVSDGIYFKSVDESAALTAETICTAGSDTTSVATLGDTTDITLEFFFDGTTLTWYVDGVSKATLAYSALAFPNDEYLTPMLAMLTGEGTANTMTVYWARALQLRQAV